MGVGVKKVGLEMVGEDLVRFWGDHKALKKIGLFDTASEMKKISKGAFTNWVLNVLRERRALALSLEDIKSSVDKVHQMLSVFVGFIIFEICLLILELASIKSVVFIVSQLGLIVAFGVTYKKTFDSLYFLFVVHPFDVGDRCEINGEQMIVERMNISTTEFLHHGNLKTSYENTELSTKSISNYRRSPDRVDSIDFHFHAPPSPEINALMMERIECYIENKSDYWKPGSKMLLRDAMDTNQIKVSLLISHRMNFQDMDERLKRRALLVGEMIKIFDDLNIECYIIPMEINVGNLSALAWNRLL
ncbi:mechanosensitive ion channel protein 8-like [Bidens hawaiensis]|uniref:mechanosensitive ion channel protein 8-like n=1 Tax=Bidens hawaiensis TaxID=980011 RepID=UPI00404965FC